MKRLAMFFTTLCIALSVISCNQRAPGGCSHTPPASRAERLRQSIASEWASAFFLGVSWETPPLTNNAALHASLERLHNQKVSLIRVEDSSPSPGDTSRLIRAARKHGIRVALAPSWTRIPSDSSSTLLHRFWNSLDSKPAAMAVGETLSESSSIAPFGLALRTNASLRITTIGSVSPDASVLFASSVPESALLCGVMRLFSNAAGTTNDYDAFLRDGATIVASAAKGSMTPLAMLAGSGGHSAPHRAWTLWAAVALGFKGIILSSPLPPSPSATSSLGFGEIDGLRRTLGALVKSDDFLGLTPILGKTYPGDFSQLFLNPRTKQVLAAVVLSPERPPAEPVTLRGGAVTPVANSPALNRLLPGHGGLYLFPLDEKAFLSITEARSYSAMPRHLRNELFVPTFGNRFSVLVNNSATPQLLHCSEPVALLVHPNITLTPLAGAKPLLMQESRKTPSFRSAHVSGHTLYRIGTVNRYQRIVLLEENGSVPGFDVRASAIANIAVTNNGICPRPSKKDTPRLPASQCLSLIHI